MTALLKEVADILADHGDLPCAPTVSQDGGNLTLTVVVLPPHAGFSTLALRHELEYLRDVATMRAIADRYGINSAAIEAMLPNKERE